MAIATIAGAGGTAKAVVLGTGQSYYYAPTSVNAGGYDASSHYDLGSAFTITSPIVVYALGSYEGGPPSASGQPTLTSSPGDTYATLYQATTDGNPQGGGTQIASALIPSGTVLENDGFAFATLATPLTLQPGTYDVQSLSNYAGGTGTGSGYVRINAGQYSVGTGITIFNSAANNGNSVGTFNLSGTAPGTYPSFFNNGALIGGGNFIYGPAASTPEPGVIGLLGAGGLLALRRRRTA